MSDYKPTGTPRPSNPFHKTASIPTNIPQSTTASARTANPTSASTPAVSTTLYYLTAAEGIIASNKRAAEFAAGKVDPVEAGKKGGHTSGGGEGGSSEGGEGGKGQFAGGKVDPVEAGKKGGNS